MMDLADRVIAANEQESAPLEEKETGFFGVELSEIDEYGLPTMDSIDYFVARMVRIDQDARDGHLHLRNDGHIWKGDHWVSENQENLYRLAEWRYPIKTWQKEAIWKRLREVLPSLSRDKYVVADDLVWNRKEARLEQVNNKPNTVK